MVRRFVWGLIAVLAIGASTAVTVAVTSAAQEPASEFVKCPAGEVCLAPAVTLERD